FGGPSALARPGSLFIRLNRKARRPPHRPRPLSNLGFSFT
ncbi:hypothetical protein BMAFMH_C0284, partial [Burkholderia mallei FMH]